MRDQDSTQEDELRTLRAELEQIATDGLEIWERQEAARALRFCEWEGQSEDGRKHAADLGDHALPFEGAADNRIPLIDLAITEKVRLCRRSFFRSLVQTKSNDSGDGARSANTTALLTWLRDRAMRAELETEVELSAQYLFGDDPGVAVVEVCWLQDLGLVRRNLSFDELAQMFATGAASPEQAAQRPPAEPELLGEFMDLATNPERDAEWVDWLEAMFPGATRKALRAAARELRKTGYAELPVPQIRANRPSVRALRLFDDIFFPLGTVDIQRARSIHRREWLSEVELREREHTLGWDSAWVEEVLERGRGQSLLSETLSTRPNSTLAGYGRGVSERDHLFEVWWSYAREADELGIPGITCTVWSPVVKEVFARRTVAEYPDGEYPFVLRPRERVGRQATDSRGLSVPISTHQNEVKVQRDARGNYVQLLASPPMKTRSRQGAYEIVLGPNAQIPVQREDDFSLVTLPNFMQNSVEMEARTKEEVVEYCGLMTGAANPDRVALVQQDEVDNFLALWRDVFTKVLALAQSFYSEAELARVTGHGDMPLRLTPEDIRGGFDIAIEIDARDHNMEFALKKMDAFGKVLSYDSAGTLNRGPFAEWAAYAIDPILARRTVQPSGQVTQKMIDEERNNVANMALGIEPVMNPEGVTNPQYRLQLVQQTVMQSPRLMQLAQGDPLFQKLVQNYARYLTQQANQEQNKLIGKLGTTPTQGVPGLYPGQNAA